MSRPNILLVVTDQQRGDCLGIEGHPVLQTPYIDHWAASGCRFRRGYSAHPQCVPARRTLFTGLKGAHHGVINNFNTVLKGPTLPGELTRAGYHTHLVGKTHLWPGRGLHGFMSADRADAPNGAREANDYTRWLWDQGIHMPHGGVGHGAHVNGWAARPWHLEERFHFTTWCVDRALEFLERRDPSCPFFLNLGFHQPHEPLTPPQAYWDRYIDADLPAPVIGDWAAPSRGAPRGLPVDAWFTELGQAQQRQFQAGYYGCINHIDDQLGRLTQVLPKDTVICYTSDHGEMLGDHRLMRKTRAFEGSARIPFLLNLPRSFDIPGGQVRDDLVELMDVMPTLLDCAGAPIPAGLDGSSLLPRLRGESDWRHVLHGEMANCGGAADYSGCATGMQFLTDARWKYIWEPGPGREYLFDLQTDPRELRDLSATADLAPWREQLVAELEGRPEGFVKDGTLQTLGKATPACLPGWECPPLASLRV